MKIEIWSDVVCPFCYIGKRRLENALEQFGHIDQLEIEWKSYQLNPGLKPKSGQSIYEHLSELKGWSMEQAIHANKQVTEMAAESGLVYNMDKAVVANTRDAHRLIQYAKTIGKADAFEEILFKAYFTDGIDIGSHENLLDLAETAGLSRSESARILATDAFDDALQNDAYEGSQIGVRGVPFFVFDRKYGISGAQPAEVFERTLRQTLEAGNS